MSDTDTKVTNLVDISENVQNETSQAVSQNNPSQKLKSIMRLENLINSHFTDLKKLQVSLKEQNGMLKDAFGNDSEYLAVQEKLREIQKIKKTVKDKIIHEPAITILNEKVADLRTEIKDTQAALSDYLQQYFQESGMRQITGTDGEIMEIVTMVKLVKKRG